MRVVQYIVHRVKGIFASGQGEPQFIELKCHVCHKNLKAREDSLSADVQAHFKTPEHIEKARRRR